jgi:tetratricopeptide (TPR) repeat protein
MSDAGRLDMVPYGDISGTTVSLTSLAAPKEAKKAFEKAVKKFVSRDYDEAVEQLDQALELHPEYAAAWTLLGQVRMAQRLRPAAEAAFRKAIEADPNYVPPYSPLAQLLLVQRDMEALSEISAKGLELNPYDADLKYARAVSAFRLKDYENAAFYAQRLVETDDGVFFPDALFILAGAVKAQGDYERASRLFGEYYANRRNSRELRSMAGRELTEARLAEYTLRSMQPALP